MGKTSKAAAITTSLEAARRLAVTKQRLAGKLPSRPTREHILSVVGDLCYVQWDPIDAVAPSHIISLWSRLGNFRPSDLDSLLWDERKLFLHWTPASIVLTEDFPLLYSLMRKYPESLSKSWGGWKIRARKFLAQHIELRKRILNQLRNGPLRLSQFQDYVRTGRSPDGWSSGSDVSNMLFHLQMTGDVIIVGHEGNQNVWGLTEKFLPSWVEKRDVTGDEFEHEIAQRAIRALGTATPREIHLYFPRGRYLNLKSNLERLEKESVLHRVHVRVLDGRDERYVHDKDVQLLESMGSDMWQPRMTLLAPFDNLLGHRSRTSRMFSFDYVHENFLPKSKRKFGTFVHPILWSDKIIGRVDLLRDKKNEKLLVNSVHAEPDAPRDKEVVSKIGETLEELAGFLGAEEVVYTVRVPKAWSSLR